jgi:uncharacterized membrane protein YukC
MQIKTARKEKNMSNVKTLTTGFTVTRSIVTIVIGLLIVTSFVIFGHFQEKSKDLLDSYLAYVNTVDQGASVSTILRNVFLLF